MDVSRAWPLLVATGTFAAAVLTVAVTSVSRHQPHPRPAVVSRTAPLRSLAYQYSSVLGLGDSVTTAAACSCTSFVAQLGTNLTAWEGKPVVVVNAGVNGLTSLDLLRQVQGGHTRAVPGAVIAIAIGANDFDPRRLSQPGCSAADMACYRASLGSLTKNIDDVLATLRRGSASSGPILLLGYWNVFLDGAVGATHGQAYQQDSDALTRLVNAVLIRAAKAHGATYVDLYAAFKREDDTDLLADDGDHPSAAGHTLIAALLSEALAQRGAPAGPH
ncbi:MAG: hypothetical protein JWO12_2861 [Frankiales bacterium]|nr:hypothetical protein [Frankiales bacterium]